MTRIREAEGGYFLEAYCYTIIHFKYNYMIVILSKYNSLLILRAGQLGALVKYNSRLEGSICYHM